jgi:hypothetical protein
MHFDFADPSQKPLTIAVRWQHHTVVPKAEIGRFDTKVLKNVDPSVTK